MKPKQEKGVCDAQIRARPNHAVSVRSARNYYFIKNFPQISGPACTRARQARARHASAVSTVTRKTSTMSVNRAFPSQVNS